jgi:hypothetical protein
MMSALRRLAGHYPLEIIAAAAGIGLVQVRRFSPLPRPVSTTTSTTTSRTRRTRRESA